MGLFGKGMAAFVYPIAPVPRTVILVPWFGKPWFGNGARRMLLLPGRIRVFREGWCMDAAKLQPAAIAGTREQIRALHRGLVPSLTHALIVLARPGWRRLTETDRDFLWGAFHVPVFEQVIGHHGELLASECEAHDGLHVESPHLRLRGEAICGSPCPCGRTTPRIGAAGSAVIQRSVAACAP